MKKLSTLIILFSLAFFSCSEDPIEITGTYNIISLEKSCENSDQDISVVEGNNIILGTSFNFSGNMLFTFGNVFEAEYLLEGEFTGEEVFIDGTYSLTNEEFSVCGNNGCTDNSLPSGGNQITLMVQEGTCLLTLVGERN